MRMGRNPKEHIPSRNVKMDYHCKEVVIHRPQRRREEHLQEKLALTAIYVQQDRYHCKTPLEVRQEALVSDVPVEYPIPENKRIMKYKEKWCA